MYYYIVENGKHVKLELTSENVQKWGEFMNSPEKPFIKTALENDDNPIVVSTVFLGLDHNYMGIGDPTLYETMVFGNFTQRIGNTVKTEQWDGHMVRYYTWEEALKGHELTCNQVFGGDKCLTTMKMTDFTTTNLLGVSGEWQNSQIDSFE